MKRLPIETLAGALAMTLLAGLSNTCQANADEIIDINLNNVRNTGNMTFGIDLAGGAIGNKLAQSGKPKASTVPTSSTKGTKGTTTQTTGGKKTTPGTTGTTTQSGNNLANIGQMIGRHHHEKHGDKQDHGRRPWDSHGHEHGGGMIGSLHHHFHHHAHHDHKFAFNDHHGYQGMGNNKHSGTGNSKLAMSGNKNAGTGNSTGMTGGHKGTQSTKGNTKVHTTPLHSSHVGVQHHSQAHAMAHAGAAKHTVHSGKTGKR